MKEVITDGKLIVGHHHTQADRLHIFKSLSQKSDPFGRV
jgi:hypothetical protein